MTNEELGRMADAWPYVSGIPVDPQLRAFARAVAAAVKHEDAARVEVASDIKGGEYHPHAIAMAMEAEADALAPRQESKP